MAEVTIYGASDDLIEIEGSLREEFYASSGDESTWLIFGDGTILDVRYADNGVWRITQQSAGRAVFSKVEAPAEEEGGNYSDRVTLTGWLRWVVAAEKVTFHAITEPPL